MQILYKQATKQYIHYDASARRSDLVSDVNEATEMANDLAVSILNRCSKKLKGFESIPAESVKKSAPAVSSNSSAKIVKTPRRRFTAKERRDIYIRDKGTCGICGRFVPPDSFTVDHIVPISKGGTIEAVIGEKHIPAANTTPESYMVQKYFHDMVEAGCDAVVMEVSSQGLMLHRTQGFVFDFGIFTNIEPDHIGPNEHKDFDDYLHCKSMLLRQCKVGIVNRDDEHFDRIIEGHTCKLETYGFSEKADLRAEGARLVGRKGYLGISYHVKGLMDFPVEIDIPGKFSIYNSLTAIAICRHFKVSEENIIKALKVARVKGRIEMIKVSDEFTLMIDYAHNAMALESLLGTLKEYDPHRLVCLFGCGGNRSKLRRYEMGEVSGKMADLTIITSDNPRDEDPQAIIDDIKIGMAKTDGKYVEIPDRKEAIAYAIHHGEPGDIIVLAGKGHEDYQEIKGKKYPMDERVLIREILEEDQKA